MSRSVRTLFDSAEKLRKSLEYPLQSDSSIFQENLKVAINTYEECRQLADQISLFSHNESLDDISSADLRYLLIDYHLAQLILKSIASDRRDVLPRAREQFESFLELLDIYGILSKGDRKLHEQYLDAPSSFSTISTSNAALRRESKIARFTEEKDLKKKLEHLDQNPAALQNDDALLREIHLTNVKLCTHLTFQSLESISQEIHILALAPPTPIARTLGPDDRMLNGQTMKPYSNRLDNPLSQLVAGGKGGPILSKDGKPLQPFTLLDSRQRLQQRVFKSGHNLPTMTIDEYLEEEKRRGGIIEGGGEQSELRPEPDEDNLDKADEETMKARDWDDFTESNPNVLIPLHWGKISDMSSSAFGTLWVYVRRKRLQTGFWEFVTRNQKAWPDTFTDGTLLLYDEDAKTITVVTRDPFKSWPGLCLAEESVRLSVMPSVRQDHCVVLEKSLICLTTSTESELRMEVMGLDVEGEINQKFQAADLPILVDSHSFM